MKKRKAAEALFKQTEKKQKVEEKHGCEASKTVINQTYNVPKTRLTYEQWLAHEKQLTLVPYKPFQNRKFKRWGREPPSYKLFAFNDQYVAVPVAYGLSVFGNSNSDVVDLRYQSPLRKEVQFVGELLTEETGPIDQRPCAADIRTHLTAHDRGGVIVYPTGGGKSAIQIYTLSAILRQRALFVVVTTDLFGAYPSEIQQFLPQARIISIRRKWCENKMLAKVQQCDVCVVMLHSLARCNYPAVFFEQFGCVFFDELHLAAAATLRKAMDKASRIKYMFGFTATPDREDRMHAMYPLYFGPLIHSNTKPLKVAKFIDVLSIRYSAGKNLSIVRRVDGREQENILAMRRALSEDADRNRLLVYVLGRALRAKRRILLFTHYINHGKLLKRMLEEECARDDALKEKKIVHVTEDTSLQQRQEIYQNPHDVLITTHKLLGIGINIKWCNTICESLPFKGATEVSQSCGRLRYPTVCKSCKKPRFENGQRMLLLYLEDDFSRFPEYFKKCLKVYNQKGFQIMAGEHYKSNQFADDSCNSKQKTLDTIDANDDDMCKCKC
jgi:superfamily II DNA or RNA helicase